MMDVKFKGSKILILCSTDNMIWQFLLPHIQDLKNYGAQIECICTKTGFWFDELKDKYHLTMIDLPMTRSPLSFKNLKAYFKLKKLQKQNGYDIIYCQQAVGGMLGRLVGKKFNLPVIYTAHGYFFFKGNSKVKNFVFKTAEKILSKWTNVLITINDEDYLSSKKFYCKNLYKVSGIGLDVDKYNNQDFNKTEFKKSLGLSEQDKVILSVAEFIKRKNHKTMLKTFAKLDRNDVKFVLCGSGKLQNKMKKLASKLKIEDKVIFLGYRKDVDKIMQVSNLFYHQSFHEGLTVSIMEAMYYGLPVVASNVRGNADLVMPQGGILTDANDMNLQIKAINKILNNEKLSESMAKFNKNEVNKYLLSNVKQQFKEIYKENRFI